jgi:hypothetical protein
LQLKLENADLKKVNTKELVLSQNTTGLLQLAKEYEKINPII